MCGIAAAYSFDHSRNMASLVDQMLISQANRMGYSAGICAFHEGRENDFLITREKGLGPIDTAFGINEDRAARIGRLEGYLVLGQGRYATSSANNVFTERQRLAMAQPYVNNSDIVAETFGFGFNGHIANYEQLYMELRGAEEGYHVRTDTDTEVMRIFLKREIIKALRKSNNGPLDQFAFKDVFATLDEKFVGAYSMAFIDGTGNLILARDPHGVRPLVFTVQDDCFLGASEPTAFYHQGIYDNVHDVEPGHFVMVDREHNVSDQIQFASKGKKLCGFGRVYFGHVNAVSDEISNQRLREAQGGELSLLDKDFIFDERHIIAPIPETARSMVDGYIRGCNEQGKRPPNPTQLLVKLKHFRNFMQDKPKDRQEKVRAKWGITPGIAEGLDLILVDDSVVRGDVTAGLMPYIREVAKPNKIHVRIAWDRYQHPCFQGIDTPDAEFLLAPNFGGDVEKMRDFLQVDSLAFLPTETNRRLLAEQSGLSEEEFCMACADGCYSTEFEKRLAGLIDT